MQRLGVALLLVYCCGVGCGAPPTARSTAALSIPRTVYLAFDGATLQAAGADDAPVSQSALSAATVPAYATASAPLVSAAVAEAVFIDRLRGYLLPFDVTLVTSPPPAATDYTLVAIGGIGSEANAPAGTAGLAQLDCTATNLDHVDYDFARPRKPPTRAAWSASPETARTHWLGHTWGLEHTSAPLDLMYVVPTPARTLPQMFQLGYVGGALSGYAGGEGVPAQPACGHPDPVDEKMVLEGVLGAATPTADQTPPTLSFTLDGATVTADATDDTGVVRVEIYVDLDLQAAPSAPPYVATLTLPPSAASDGYFVTVEAIDAAANRATQTRYVAPGPLDGGAPLDAAPADAASPPPAHASSGCAFGAGARPPAPPFAFLAVALLLACRRRRGPTVVA